MNTGRKNTQVNLPDQKLKVDEFEFTNKVKIATGMRNQQFIQMGLSEAKVIF